MQLSLWTKCHFSWTKTASLSMQWTISKSDVEFWAKTKEVLRGTSWVFQHLVTLQTFLSYTRACLFNSPMPNTEDRNHEPNMLVSITSYHYEQHFPSTEPVSIQPYFCSESGTLMKAQIFWISGLSYSRTGKGKSKVNNGLSSVCFFGERGAYDEGHCIHWNGCFLYASTSL